MPLGLIGLALAVSLGRKLGAGRTGRAIIDEDDGRAVIVLVTLTYAGAEIVFCVASVRPHPILPTKTSQANHHALLGTAGFHTLMPLPAPAAKLS